MKCVLGSLSCAGPYAPDGSAVCNDCAEKHDENLEETRKHCKCNECYFYRQDNGLGTKELN
jgi:hypothetical protein